MITNLLIIAGTYAILLLIIFFQKRELNSLHSAYDATKRRAEVAEYQLRAIREINKKVNNIKEVQELETINETTKEHLSLRNDFESDSVSEPMSDY